MDPMSPTTSELVATLSRDLNGTRHSSPSWSLRGSSSSRLISSSRASSQSSLRDNEKKQQEQILQIIEDEREFCVDAWMKLRDHALTYRRSEDTSEALRHRFDNDPEIGTWKESLNYAVEKQNLEMIVNRLQKKVIQMRKRVASKKIGRLDNTQLEDVKEVSLNEIKTEIAKCEGKVAANEKEIKRLRPRLHIFHELLKHRRRHMIGDLLTYFPIRTVIDPDTPSPSSQKCGCTEKHFIRSIHLPWTTKLPGHDDTTLTAGFALLIQLLSLFSLITDTHLRYPVQLTINGSEIKTADNGRIISLVSNARNKSERARMDEATNLLLRNLAQIRSDCGVHTKRMERTLFVLDDIMRVLARGEQGECEVIFGRPWDTSYSIASLMPAASCQDRAVMVLDSPEHTPDHDQLDEEVSFISHGVEASETSSKTHSEDSAR